MQARILEEFFEFVTTNLNADVDLIIYIRTNPEVALHRIQQRSRYEERDIKLDYIKLIGDLYDQWLLHARNKKIIIINGNATTHEMLKELEKKIQKKQ